MTSIILARSCANCFAKFKDQNSGQLVCRLNPPSVMPIMIPNTPQAISRGAAPVQVVGYATQFPQVSPEMFCTHHKPGLAINEHEMSAMPRVEGSRDQ